MYIIFFFFTLTATRGHFRLMDQCLILLYHFRFTYYLSHTHTAARGHWVWHTLYEYDILWRLYIFLILRKIRQLTMHYQRLLFSFLLQFLRVHQPFCYFVKFGLGCPEIVTVGTVDGKIFPETSGLVVIKVRLFNTYFPPCFDMQQINPLSSHFCSWSGLFQPGVRLGKSGCDVWCH